MTKPEKPRALFFNEDFKIVILGAHLDLKDAVELAEHDIGDVELNNGKCISVKRVWARYGFLSPEECDWDVEPGDQGWTLICQSARPKGIVTKATLMEFEKS